MSNRNTIAAALGLSVVTLLLGACANEPTMTERNFGESVRQMVRAQTYDPSTLETPSLEPIDGTDGQLLEGTVETYRGGAAEDGSAGSGVTINVGGGQ